MDNQNIKSIEVNVDTNVIEENTADSTQIKIVYETPVSGTEYVLSDGTKLKVNSPSNDGELSLEETVYVTLGDIKREIDEVTTKITELQATREQLEAKLLLATPKVDEAIQAKVNEPATVDNRVEEAVNP